MDGRKAPSRTQQVGSPRQTASKSRECGQYWWRCELTTGFLGDGDKEVDEVTDMFKDLAKKKKKKSKPKEGDEDAPAADGEFDPSALKKKKKKKAPKVNRRHESVRALR